MSSGKVYFSCVCIRFELVKKSLKYFTISTKSELLVVQFPPLISSLKHARTHARTYIYIHISYQ